MTERNYDSPLPEVSNDDILQAFSESLLGTPEHNQWIQFAKSQPVLAREVLTRVAFSFAGDTADTLNLQRIVINSAAFVVSSLENAVKRSKLAPHDDTQDAA